MRIADADLERALELARAGEGRGFEMLFEATGPSVAGYLRSRRVHDPDGLANEVFLRAFRTIHTFVGDAGRFRSWLFTIAHNTAIDDARRQHRRLNEVPMNEKADPVGGNVETDAMARLAYENVRDLLERLSPDQRDVIVLRVVGDLSVEQTAAVVGKSFEAVKALQRRGLATLRRSLCDTQGVPK